jgi:hypothetical protein
MDGWKEVKSDRAHRSPSDRLFEQGVHLPAPSMLTALKHFELPFSKLIIPRNAISKRARFFFILNGFSSSAIGSAATLPFCFLFHSLDVS